tara:strand:+ start:14784 stop:15578 length:795 start_codon:yes stop_codon:yes gene_type:complete
MSTYLPKGLKSGAVISPDELGDEFVRASVVASETTQYQWTDETFQDSANSNIDLLKSGTGVTSTEVSQAAFFRYNSQTWADGSSGQEPLLTVAAGDPELYHIPYNRGFSKITGTQDMEISWTTQYPELVLVAFSYQGIRKHYTDFDAYLTGANYIYPQVQTRITINGGSIIGTGAAEINHGGETRGQGLQNRAVRTTTIGMTLVPPGTHTVTAEAAQPQSYGTSFSNLVNGDVTSFDNPPDEGVCVGHRRLILLRFPKGKLLGG